MWKWVVTDDTRVERAYDQQGDAQVQEEGREQQHTPAGRNSSQYQAGTSETSCSQPVAMQSCLTERKRRHPHLCGATTEFSAIRGTLPPGRVMPSAHVGAAQSVRLRCPHCPG